MICNKLKAGHESIENPTQSSSEATAAAGVTEEPTGEEEKRERGETDERSLCKICYAEEVSIVTLPCRHLATCVKCTQNLTTCTVCRRDITAVIRVFLP